MRLTFTVPKLATDGEELTKPVEVEILRSVIPAGFPSPAAPPRPSIIKLLSSPALAHFVIGGKAAIPLPFSEAELSKQQGSIFTFEVVPFTRGFRGRRIEAPPSNRARQMLLDVSSPPQNLKVETTETALNVSWDASTRTLAGRRPVTHLAGYVVYLSRTGNPGSFESVDETAATRFRFTDFQFGKAYFFKVRARFSVNGNQAESEASQPVFIEPRDIFPPAPPKGLSAIATAAGIELLWEANREPDLAGYNVYRREEHTEFVRINNKLLLVPLFRDASVRAGGKYFYAVTAKDLSGNESAKSLPVEVSAR